VVYFSIIPPRLEKLKQRITYALETVSEVTLQCIWQELDYENDAHMEYF